VQQGLAIGVAQRWRMLWQIENQTLFGRLYLHAAMSLQELSVDEAIGTSLERGDVLWRYEYEPELLALLRIRGSEISQALLSALVAQLLTEPARDEDRTPDVDYKRRKRLAKLLQAGVSLEGPARVFADEYLAERPPAKDPREDEVRYRVVEARWVGAPSAKELTGKRIEEIIELLGQGRDEHGFPHDEWSRAKRVAEWLRQETSRIVETLEALAARNDTPAGFTDGVFWALRDVTTQREVLDQIERAVETLDASPSMIDAAFDACSAWVKALATGDVPDDTFWRIWDLVCRRAPADEAVSTEDMSLTAAINSAGGYLTEAVLDRFWKTEPRVGQGLPTGVRDRLTQLVSGTSRLAAHARLVCMPPLHALYAVDPDWTHDSLLGYLRWTDPENDPEVSPLWATQLNYGRWSLDLMAALKDDFLITLGKKENLDDAYRSACWRFAALGIDHPNFLSDAEVRDGFHSMGPEGAVFVLDLFETRLRQSEQPESQWREMMAPWLVTHWPPLERFRTEAILTAAAQMLLETRGAFSEALQTLQGLHLVGLINRDRLVLFGLARAEDASGEEGSDRFAYATSFPVEVCRWLDQILPPNLPGYEQHDLNTIIAAIQRHVRAPVDPECLVHLRERAQ
jgi:hypothetical protein